MAFDPTNYVTPKMSAQEKCLKKHGRFIEHTKVNGMTTIILCEDEHTMLDWMLRYDTKRAIWGKPGESLKEILTRLGWYDPVTNEYK